MPADSSSPGLPCLPQREAAAHKGRFGLALIVGGSRGMAGAAALAGMAALRGGAGLVRVAVPDECLESVAASEPCYMTVPLVSDRRGRIALDALPQILHHAEQATVVAVGPGLGRSLGLDAVVSQIFEALPLPLVLDADGLNALAARLDRVGRPAGPRVLTPHPGEFERLSGVKPRAEEERIAAAAELAARLGVVIVLKGHRTVISDGQRTVVNTTGNPGMATGGSGDVLTGLIASLICQHLEAFEAAYLGVFLHGLAGDMAAESLGQESLIASDLVASLPAAFGQYRKGF
jgi:NAD(P)H-hydrate epimerase